MRITWGALLCMAHAHAYHQGSSVMYGSCHRITCVSHGELYMTRAHAYHQGSFVMYMYGSCHPPTPAILLALPVGDLGRKQMAPSYAGEVHAQTRHVVSPGRRRQLW